MNELTFTNYRRITASSDLNQDLQAQLKALNLFDAEPDTVAEVVDVVDEQQVVRFQVIFYGFGEAAVFAAGTTVTVANAVQHSVDRYKDADLCWAIADAFERAEPRIQNQVDFRVPRTERMNTIPGELRYYETDELWWFKLKQPGRDVVFWIGGSHTPNPAFLKKAEAIANDFDQFQAELFGQLREHTNELGKPSIEPEQLAIREVGCWTEENPELQNVYLSDSSGNEVWRCDLVGIRIATLEREDGPLVDPES